MSDKLTVVQDVVLKMRSMAESHNGQTVTVSKDLWQFISDLLETTEKHYQEVLELAKKFCE